MPEQPQDLPYRAPRTAFVARFIDAGTIIRGPAKRYSDQVEIAAQHILVRGHASPSLPSTEQLAAVVPPDRIRVSPGENTQDSDSFTGTFERLIFTGSVFQAHVCDNGFELRVALTVEERAALQNQVQEGSRVTASWAPEDVIFVEDSAGAKASDPVAVGRAASTSTGGVR